VLLYLLVIMLLQLLMEMILVLGIMLLILLIQMTLGRIFLLKLIFIPSLLNSNAGAHIIYYLMGLLTLVFFRAPQDTT